MTMRRSGGYHLLRIKNKTIENPWVIENTQGAHVPTQDHQRPHIIRESLFSRCQNLLSNTKCDFKLIQS